MGSSGCPRPGGDGGEGSEGAGCAKAAPSPPRLGGTAAPLGTCWGFSQRCQPAQTGRQPSDPVGGAAGGRGVRGGDARDAHPLPSVPSPAAVWRIRGCAPEPAVCGRGRSHACLWSCHGAAQQHLGCPENLFFIRFLAPCSSVPGDVMRAWCLCGVLLSGSWTRMES